MDKNKHKGYNMSKSSETSGAYILNIPTAGTIRELPETTIVTRLAIGTPADLLLLDNTMNNKSYTDYLLVWKQERSKQQLEEPVTRSGYLAVRDEVLYVLDESFKE